MAKKLKQDGYFWGYIEPVKQSTVKTIPPQPVWLNESYLPGLKEAKDFNIDLMSDDDLQAAYIRKDSLIFDIECYENYFLVAFKSVDTGKVFFFEMTDSSKLNSVFVKWVIDNFSLIGFNSFNYDVPILTLALAGKSCADLKKATNDLIVGGMRPYDVLKKYKVKKLAKLDHIDLIEVAPLDGSLKIYAGRLHCKKMQDLPFDPDINLNSDQIAILRWYCVNGDIVNTLDLYNSLRTELELREEMGKRYKVDLRSKSDAQIAEAVIRWNLEKKGIITINIPEVEAGKYFYYKAPSYIKFKTLDILERLKNNPFFITESGKPVACYYADFIDWSDNKDSLRLSPTGEWVRKPSDWKYNPVTVNGTQYTMGVGGLHSVEKTVSYYSDDEFTLKDIDVESYYPRIILNLGLYPEQIGKRFLEVFNGIVEERLLAKKEKRKKDSDSLKICINGSFGKFGSKYSILYSPELIIQTTITGQLSLLMLIERFEEVGIKVISANTDGIVSKVPKYLDSTFEAIYKQWEKETNFKMEETAYRSLHSRDVNNYVAVKPDGSVKCKGAYSNHWNDNSTFRLHKNPTNLICIDAITAYLTTYKPIEETIRTCTDITKFITVRYVKGGSAKLWQDYINDTINKIEYLGKAVRWYYSTASDGDIVYAKSGNKVPRSENAKPLMELPDAFPSDIDYNWYEKEAYDILKQIGVINEN